MSTTKGLPPELQQRRIVDMRTAAEFIGVTKRHFERIKAAGEAPPAIKIGTRKLGFRVCDLEIWLAAREQPQSTAA